MSAIMRRELSAYFTSPIGYIFLSVFYIFAGFFFFTGTLASSSTDMTGVFSGLSTITMFLIPILTMRLMSEDKKQKTDQALLTAPVNLFSLVLGKFLAALIVFAFGLVITVVFAATVSFFAAPDWAVVFGNFVGSLFYGSALISIGLFISSLTENQMIAAVGSFAVMIALNLIDAVATLMPNQFLQDMVLGISFYQRYTDFTTGIFNFSNIIFFLSVCAVFLFLTTRVLEKRRWS